MMGDMAGQARMHEAIKSNLGRLHWFEPRSGEDWSLVSARTEQAHCERIGALRELQDHLVEEGEKRGERLRAIAECVHLESTTLRNLVNDETGLRQGAEESGLLTAEGIIEVIEAEIAGEVAKRKASDEFVLGVIEDVARQQKVKPVKQRVLGLMR